MGLRTLIIFLLLTTSAWAQPWPQSPPQIGRLELKQEYWDYIKEAARRYQISPYLIQAVCAIESRYDPQAKSGKCFGLMQLHKDTAKKYHVNPRNPRENIMGGAVVLARLMGKYHGDIRRVLRVYNSTCTEAYEREVIRAYKQAQLIATASLPSSKPKHYACRLRPCQRSALLNPPAIQQAQSSSLPRPVGVFLQLHRFIEKWRFGQVSGHACLAFLKEKIISIEMGSYLSGLDKKDVNLPDFSPDQPLVGGASLGFLGEPDRMLRFASS